jgi:hypothetical protein
LGTLLRILTVIPPPFNMVVLIVLIASIAGVLTAVSKNVREYFVHREELDLKREMIESGMSAEEIERVLLTRSTETRALP